MLDKIPRQLTMNSAASFTHMLLPLPGHRHESRPDLMLLLLHQCRLRPPPIHSLTPTCREYFSPRQTLTAAQNRFLRQRRLKRREPQSWRISAVASPPATEAEAMAVVVTDVVARTAMISEQLRQGQVEEALDSFFNMCHDGVAPNEVTYTVVLPVAGEALGRQIHALLLKRCLGDEFLGSALIHMYSRSSSSSSIEEARQVFEEFVTEEEGASAVLLAAMIGAYAAWDMGKEAFQVLVHMFRRGIRANRVALTAALSASDLDVALGRQIHGCLVKTMPSPDCFVTSALVHFYAGAGNIEDARKAFRGR